MLTRNFYWLWSSVCKTGVMSLLWAEETEAIRCGPQDFPPSYTFSWALCQHLALTLLQLTLPWWSLPHPLQGPLGPCSIDIYPLKELAMTLPLDCIPEPFVFFLSPKVLLKRWSVFTDSWLLVTTHLTVASTSTNQMAWTILFERPYGKLGGGGGWGEIVKEGWKKRLFLRYCLLFVTIFLCGLSAAFDTNIVYISSVSLALEKLCVCVFLLFPPGFQGAFVCCFFLNLSSMLNNFREAMNTVIMVLIFHGRGSINLMSVSKGLGNSKKFEAFSMHSLWIKLIFWCQILSWV